MDIEDKNVYTAVLYCDGSAGPSNPGPYGGGCHGYLYTDDAFRNNGDKPTKYTVTDRGYLEKHELTDDDRVVKPELYYNAVYPYGSNGTNNQAELMAIADTINIICSNSNIRKLILYSDSMYAIGVYKVVSSDLTARKWLLMDRPNLDIWATLADVLANIGDVEISVRKIKAHGTAIGNNTADRLAYSAREMGAKGITERKYMYYEGKYWTDKPVPNPLLNFKQVYFNAGIMSTVNEHTYAIMDYPKQVETGKKSPEPLFGITILSEEYRPVSSVINAYCKHTNGNQYITAVDLRVLHSQPWLKMEQLLGEHVYTYTRNRQLKLLGEQVIAAPILPAGLAQNALSKTLTMYSIYKNYNPDNLDDGIVKYIDITDQMTEANSKGKLVYNVPSASPGPVIKFTLDDREHTVTLIHGKDMLTNIQMRKVIAGGGKVNLVVRRVNSKQLEYYVFIITDTAVGVYGNFYTNRIYLTDK